MNKKTIDPVTGRLFLKHSLQDDLVVKLERERERFEKRFGHIETEVDEAYAKAKEDAEAEYKLIREMSVDNDQVLPDARTRHWMVAQTHLMMQQGKDEVLKEAREDEANVRKAIAEQLSASEDEELEQFEASEGFSLPDEYERQRAKKAFDDITSRLKKRDMNSDTLFEDLLSEKAYDLERFVSKPGGDSVPGSAGDPTQDLLDSANELAGSGSAEVDDEAVKEKIRAIMKKYAAPAAKGGKSYNTHEATKAEGKDFAAPLQEPEVRFQK